MRIPTWDELVGPQRDVLEAPLRESLFVAGPPGSGKTTLAVQRARALRQDSQRVLFITFNRVLRRAVRMLEEDVDVSTMHGYVSSHYHERTSQMVPAEPFDGFAWRWSDMLDRLRTDRTVARYDHLMVDEAQDLPEEFFLYARRHIAPHVSVFADENQTITARCSTLEQIQRAGQLPHPILLADNFRNTPEIVELANHFHGGRLPAMRVQRQSIGHHPRARRFSSLDETCAAVARWFSTRGGSIGLVVNKNDTGRQARDLLRPALPGIRVGFYTSADKNEDQLALFEPGVTILNVESVKGQEFDTVFVLELDAFVPCNTVMAQRRMYMLCSRARDYLFLVYGPGDLSPQARAALPAALIGS